MILEINRKGNGQIQHLTEVLPEIPTNTILYKQLTGLGATYGELKAKRNSIIIEPNKPVISGKCNDPKHSKDNLLGVFEGIYTDEIVEYLEKTLETNKFIKIMTTPESFSKVRSAFGEIEMDLRFNCFLLFDECHKIVKDVDYRENIKLPMDLFFQCENKALVSATPLNFTDPRLEEFESIEIIPTFEYRQQLTLHITNNVLQTTRELVEKLEDGRNFFIFCNSTDNAFSLMEQLQIKDASAVFCSQKSVDKLKEYNFKDASEFWNPARMKKYNFMTSRFYNALDIELKEKPIVILFTDSYFTEYTCFDPFVDTVQCVGRFRYGVAGIHHVTNVNSKFRHKTIDEIKGYVTCSKEIYEQLDTFRKSATTYHFKEAYSAAIECLPYSKWLSPDNSVNYFIIDNFIDDEIIKGYYSNSATLIEAYSKSEHFIVQTEIHTYKIGDYERLRRYNKSISIKAKRKIIVEQLDSLGECETSLDFLFKQEISNADPFIVEAYDKIGKAEIERLNYKEKKIKEAMIYADYKVKATGTEILKVVKNSFVEGHWYEGAFIRKEIKRIFEKFEVKPCKAITSHTINDFFDAIEQKKHNKRGYLLLRNKTI